MSFSEFYINVIKEKDINLQQLCKLKILNELYRCYYFECNDAIVWMTIDDFFNEDNIIMKERIYKLSLPVKLRNEIIHELKEFHLIEDLYFKEVIEKTIEY